MYPDLEAFRFDKTPIMTDFFHKMLAPPFTRENAGEMARRATISRERNRVAKLRASNDFTPIERAKKQVNRVLGWMERTKDKDEFARLSGILDKLWNKAYPTQASVRTRLQRSQPVVELPDVAG